MSQILLISGLGSVGSRHAKNFCDLGYQIVGSDPNEDRRKRALSEGFASEVWAELDDALESKGKDLSGVVICSPTSIHPPQIHLCLNYALPVLSEKPLGSNLQEVSALNSLSIKPIDNVLVGYTWRWWPALRKLKNVLDRKEIGKPLFARVLVSAHLADWHPWEDYRDFFMSSEKLGGGALLDESHWIDQMVWFFGLPDHVFGSVGKVSDLDITSDDSVDAIFSYECGLTISIHLDIFGRPHEKMIQVIGSQGTVSWSEVENKVKVCVNGSEQKCYKFDEERNFMFQAVAREFHGFIQGNPIISCDWEDGIRTMAVIEAVRQSNSIGKSVSAKAVLEQCR